MQSKSIGFQFGMMLPVEFLEFWPLMPKQLSKTHLRKLATNIESCSLNLVA